MSHQVAIYNAYLERWKREHPDVVDPTVVESEQFTREVCLDKGKTVLRHGGRYWQAGPACPVYCLSDGRVAEETWVGSRPLYAVFKGKAEWYAYDRPEPIHIYFEQW